MPGRKATLRRSCGEQATPHCVALLGQGFGTAHACGHRAADAEVLHRGFALLLALGHALWLALPNASLPTARLTDTTVPNAWLPDADTSPSVALRPPALRIATSCTNSFLCLGTGR